MLKYLAGFRLFFITPVFHQVNSLIQWSSTGTAGNQVKYARKSLEMHYRLYRLLESPQDSSETSSSNALGEIPRPLVNFPSVFVVVM